MGRWVGGWMEVSCRAFFNMELLFLVGVFISFVSISMFVLSLKIF